MSKDYILTSRSGILTARNLAEALNLNIRYNPKEKPPKIRWGNSNVFSKDAIPDTDYNNKDLISKVQTKPTFSRIAKELNIIHLEYFLANNIGMEIPNKYPVYIRTLIDSCGGKGIIIARNEEEYLPYRKYWYTYYEPFVFELRVHVLGGNIVKIFKKIKTDGEDEEEYPIRNNDRGYHFSVREISLYPKLQPFVSKLYEKFPINMMGLDVGYNAEKGTYVVIEINSCPSLNNETISLYIDYLKDKI